MKHNISRAIAVDVAIDPVAAGATAANGKVIDMSGFEAAVFVIQFGAITAGAVTGVKIQSGNDPAGNDMADVAGSAVSVPDTASSKGVISAEVHRPLNQRFIRIVVTRGTANAVVAGGFVLLGRSGVTPPALRAAMANTQLPPIVAPYKAS